MLFLNGDCSFKKHIGKDLKKKLFGIILYLFLFITLLYIHSVHNLLHNL